MTVEQNNGRRYFISMHYYLNVSNIAHQLDKQDIYKQTVQKKGKGPYSLQLNGSQGSEIFFTFTTSLIDRQKRTYQNTCKFFQLNLVTKSLGRI